MSKDNLYKYDDKKNSHIEQSEGNKDLDIDTSDEIVVKEIIEKKKKSSDKVRAIKSLKDMDDSSAIKALLVVLGVLIIFLIISIITTKAYKDDGDIGNETESVSGQASGDLEDIYIKEPETTESYEPLDNSSKLYKLIEAYYKAKKEADIEAMSKCLDNDDNIKVQVLEKQKKYIEDYKNIECYALKTRDDKSIILLASVDYKFYGIETPAPSPIYFYIVEVDGEYLIHNMTVNDRVNMYINELKEKEAVIALETQIDAKFKEACEKDKNLKEIWELINQ